MKTEFINLKTKTTNRSITIFGCGKFQESSIVLGKTEAKAWKQAREVIDNA